MSRFVLDNTVTMAWCFSEEATPFTETLLGRLSSLIDSAVVPALWLYEVVNVTGLAVREGRITDDKACASPESLADLPIEIEDPTRPRLLVSVRALSSDTTSRPATPPVSNGLTALETLPCRRTEVNC